MIHIQPISAFSDNYIWLIIDSEKQLAYCVDPGEATGLLQVLKQQRLNLQAIFLTHHHDDHQGGVEDILAHYPNIPVYGPKDPRMPKVTHSLQEPDSLSFANFEFKVLNTPGHTATHISYYEPHFHWLFCGDTLFSGGCGRVFDGTIEMLFDSLQKLKTLPDNTQIYCAHEYTQKNLHFASLVEPQNLAIQAKLRELTSHKHLCSLPSNLALEKQINPFLRTDTPELHHYAHQKGLSVTPLSIFKQIRADKDRF